MKLFRKYVCLHNAQEKLKPLEDFNSQISLEYLKMFENPKAIYQLDMDNASKIICMSIYTIWVHNECTNTSVLHIQAQYRIYWIAITWIVKLRLKHRSKWVYNAICQMDEFSPKKCQIQQLNFFTIISMYFSIYCVKMAACLVETNSENWKYVSLSIIPFEWLDKISVLRRKKFIDMSSVICM